MKLEKVLASLVAVAAMVLAGVAVQVVHAVPANGGDDGYYAMIADFNPGQFWIDHGKKLFYEKRGPKHASLENCDFGLGPGVLKGAYAQMPRYFKDTGRVETLEGRLLTCSKHLQGIDPKTLLVPHYLNANEKNGTEDKLTDLTAFVASKSNGMPYDPPVNNAQEKYAYALGRYMFNRRQGKMDLSCADCHAHPGRTIRGVPLPIMTDPKGAGFVMTKFPAYVIKDGNVRTFWWRNERCVLAQRLPWLKTGSELDAALTLFMEVNAARSKMPIKIPGIRPRA